MVFSRTSIASAVFAVALCASRVQGHGYMLIPESQFSGTATSSWIVQIDPQWESDGWNGNSQDSVDTYVSLAEEKGVTQIRSLLDDTSIYGADCGYTDPDGTAQDIPTDSTATFSRGMVHVGPCEIWLDDTMVLHDDNCYSTYGGDDQDVKSVFPVDYSSCDSGGCSMMRFYWLAFQGVDDETVWQVYKDCIPLTGGSGTSTSTSNNSTSSSSTKTSSSESTETPTTDAPSSDSNDSKTTDAPSASKDNNDDDDDDNSDDSKSVEGDSDEDKSSSESTPEPTSTEAASSTSSSTSTTSTSTTTSSTSSTSSSVPDGTWPTSQGTVQYDEVYVVAAGETFDGGMKTYERSDITCEGQTESGTSTAVFSVEAGGTLKNVIIGTNQMEGVHCDDHDCTIENVWWEDVCEDALSIKGGDASSVSTVTGGGAKSADDKVIQHNGYGTVKIDGFYAEDFGKLYRSCGTCGDRQRFVTVSNVYVVNPGVSVVTVNENYGDEATLSNIYIKADDDSYDVCAWSEGNEDGEPTELGAGIKDPLCQYSDSDIHIVS